jgi:heme/copper-type cytochrome/quinol oxidase subunit 2
MAKYLKSTFPEIANAVAIHIANTYCDYEEARHKIDYFLVDSSFFKMFDVKIVEGSMDFLIPGINKIAITRAKSSQMFGNENPVGKRVKIYRDFSEICAVVTEMPKPSNYPFDFLSGLQTDSKSSTWWYGDMLVETVPGIDVEAFEKKLDEHKFQNNRLALTKNMVLTPLTEIRYKDENIHRDVRFQYIIIFALAGSLLILCTLFNYLTLFISRFKMRQRELALRVVYGASGRSLFTMLSIEFLLSLIAALLLGLALINILSSSFRTVSKVHLELSAIYLESGIYITGIIVVALTFFVVMLMLFRRRTLNANIRGNKKIFRKISIVIQLIISIVFAFCTFIILKQMYYLHSSDLGFAIKNRGAVRVDIDQTDVLNNKMKQIPEIKETLLGQPLLQTFDIAHQISDWDGKQIDAEPTNAVHFWFTEQYAKFYEIQLVEGEFLRNDDDKKYVLINEAAAKFFGWDKAVGKSFSTNGYKYVVKGVVKNIYNYSPTYAARQFYYSNKPEFEVRGAHFILFKYDEGSWKTCIDKINNIIKEEFPNKFCEYHNEEEEYNKFLKSENTLLAILTVVSIVCVIVCIFGFVSMVSLTCEERRKEIAIRKINGATVKDILDIFFKEYLTLLAVGALIAFPVGYIIMKRWLEQYVIQTEMSAWVYLLILLSLIMVIVVSVGGRVYKTSHENPVNALNK